MLSLFGCCARVIQALNWIPSQFVRLRRQLTKQVSSDGDLHLLIVRHGPEHNVHRAWFYHEADVDRATIVWAREMSWKQSGELTFYFAGREVWLLDAT